ncbi:hypothetical protein SLS63_013706 [Diaporthe eres]|uniref:Cytochrome P450 n=1 Tax=Diaporthe eres TaxID=83184 RepID=A0ABR1NMR2_DIAER
MSYDLENKAMLSGLMDRPDLFLDHIKRFTTSLTTQMIFGFRVLKERDPLSKELFYSFVNSIRTLPLLTNVDKLLNELQAATLLDTYPVLRYLPDLLVPAQRKARDFHKAESKIFLRLHIGMKEKACFSRDLIRVQEEEGMPDDQAAYTSGSLLQGGLGSTTETLTGFVKAMIMFPNVVKAAQDELDRVCYRLPKGATVIYNVRAIQNDPERYDNPRLFDPARWSDDTQTAAQSATNADVSKRDHFMFGAGRRMCQGIHIAERSLFLAVSRLLWAFNFQRAVDPATGCEIPLSHDDDLQGGMFVMPRPFQARITPRDDEKARIVKEAWKEASESLLDENLQWKSVREAS